jgi:heme/copper-type cytochrome/quinol oxidase subunit 3
MGSYFLYGQAVEWSGLSFGFGDGLFGGTFFLLSQTVHPITFFHKTLVRNQLIIYFITCIKFAIKI